jgi:hypothetical protein
VLLGRAFISDGSCRYGGFGLRERGVSFLFRPTKSQEKGGYFSTLRAHVQQPPHLAIPKAKAFLSYCVTVVPPAEPLSPWESQRHFRVPDVRVPTSHCCPSALILQVLRLSTYPANTGPIREELADALSSMTGFANVRASTAISVRSE